MAIPPDSLTLVNHASVLIRGREKAVLCDPWYAGDAFHKGWRLLHENSEAEIDEALAATTHLWLSHEHPDHFSIGFFKKYKTRLIERGIPVIFQATKDRRVASFLQKEGFTVIELKPGERHTLEDGFTLHIVPDEFYDSALIVDLHGQRIFNINDCTLHDEARIKQFHKAYGDCDVLLTQFSYAAWKGGRDNVAWRQQAAHDKLDTLVAQARIFNARVVVPFASFVRFANTLNSYLNDAVNTPDSVRARCEGAPFTCLVLRPMESFAIADPAPAQDTASLDFWRDLFASAAEKATPYTQAHTMETLAPLFAGFIARLKKNNDWWLMKLVARLPLLGAFEPLVVQLADSDLRVKLDIPRATIAATDAPADVSMHGESLAFILQQSFGYDTLTVNGTFEETRPGGFTRMTKNFAIENLNNLGYHLTPWLAFNLQLIALCFRRLFFVAKKLNPA